MNGHISVFHTITSIHPGSGGTSRVVVELADALGRQKIILPTLITQSLTGEPTVSSTNPKVQRIISEEKSQYSFIFGLHFRKTLEDIVKQNKTAIIHNHGLWMPVNHWASRIARKYDLAMIIQPHGMLKPRALNHKVWKKKIAMSVFQRRDLNIAKALIATSFAEYENIRKLGFRQPIAVIPNGVNLEKAQNINLPCSTRIKGHRTVLFLSRVHEIKGLENLVRAWAQVTPNGWRLRLAGPDEGGYIQKVMGLVRKLGVEKSVEYIGMVDSEHKSRVYLGADLFVLPTYSENFGVVVAEALAHGLPVITTRGAPWADLEKYGCGWWINLGVDPLVQALREATSLSDDERRNMGERGRKYVLRYDWNLIAHQTVEVYRWVLGLGPIPMHVILE
jgi:glycosyltransferase involved in cell wall biosynthesis